MFEIFLSNFTNIPDFSCSVKRTFTAVHIFPRFYNRLLLNYISNTVAAGSRVRQQQLWRSLCVKFCPLQVIVTAPITMQELICLHPGLLLVAMHCKKSWRSSSTPASSDAGPIHTGVEQIFRHPWRKFYYKYRTPTEFFKCRTSSAEMDFETGIPVSKCVDRKKIEGKPCLW